MGLLMIPLVGAYFVIRKPKHGLPYLAAAVVATLANGVTGKYYDLDGGATRASLVSCRNVVSLWVGCGLLAHRNVLEKLDHGSAGRHGP